MKLSLLFTSEAPTTTMKLSLLFDDSHDSAPPAA
jgi:hypothetical protein